MLNNHGHRHYYLSQLSSSVTVITKNVGVNDKLGQFSVGGAYDINSDDT